MKNIKTITILVAFLFPILYFVPWWVGVILSGLIGFFSENIKSSILIPSVGLFSCWAIIFFYRWINGGEILMERVAVMIKLNNPILLAIAILLLPLILGGLAGMSGKLIQKTLD